ncbi:phosphate ABC transporter substrate-binding protein PstS [Pseudoclavibacter chungangensis]|uniref:Phosphate-binding protein n=1 Tax=Pseudoclavibacter chungangensis TaxID=587635 RepID=A0A7J5C099_9MICO|nr:phosphate ABC transporter substrate-binding protein PstS [Pseudoclavibacter chungangensis]KAB1660329.1 phosphate ABC transporter substrate-binding protein PstS [Pseudoclavibacter chungangensis]NYJ65685.1 phosphate transport system substrate-binding protein [Pseudoclavibacter chungangensis]
MKLTRIGATLAMTAVAALTLAACATNETPATGGEGQTAGDLTGTLAGSGASSQGTAQTTWIAGFQALQPGIQINYAGGGSGAGRTDFQNGTSQFIGSDRAFKKDEIEAGGFSGCADGSDLVEIPAYISPIAIAFNVEGVDKLTLDPATLAGIFAGTITTWNDPAIAATNEGVTLPDLAINPVHRSDKSGTTGNFTEYLDAAAPDVWTYGSVEEWPIQGGEAAQETPGVQNAIKTGNGTIGYLDNSAAGDFTIASLKVGDKVVELSPDAASAVVDASTIEEGRAPTDLVYDLNRTEEGVYPVVLVSYLIGCAEYADPAVGANVKAYFEYVVSADGQNAAAETAHSAPLSADLQKKAAEAAGAIK